MSKQRVRRRAAREATAAEARRRRAGVDGRSRDRSAADRRRREQRTTVPNWIRGGRLASSGPGAGLRRRSTRQRAVIAGVVIVVLVLTVLLVDDWSMRIAIAAVTLLFAPVATIALVDRAGR